MILALFLTWGGARQWHAGSTSGTRAAEVVTPAGRIVIAQASVGRPGERLEARGKSTIVFLLEPVARRARRARAQRYRSSRDTWGPGGHFHLRIQPAGLSAADIREPHQRAVSARIARRGLPGFVAAAGSRETGEILAAVADEAQPFLLGAVGGPPASRRPMSKCCCCRCAITARRILAFWAPARPDRRLDGSACWPIGALALTSLRALAPRRATPADVTAHDFLRAREFSSAGTSIRLFLQAPVRTRTRRQAHK